MKQPCEVHSSFESALKTIELITFDSHVYLPDRDVYMSGGNKPLDFFEVARPTYQIKNVGLNQYVVLRTQYMRSVSGFEYQLKECL